MTDEQSGEKYTLEEAVPIIKRTIARKTSEVEALKKKASRLRNAERIKANNELIAYLESDISGYKTVIADMTGDSSYSKDVNLNSDHVPTPEDYQSYIDGLSADDLENEMESESIRADYCDGVLGDICIDIGKAALESKKMVRAMQDDPFALEQIGQIIFSDDYLYDLFTSVTAESSTKKKKKKKKD